MRRLSGWSWVTSTPANSTERSPSPMASAPCSSTTTQSVRPGGVANLAYTPRPISGADDFVIHVNLPNRLPRLVQVAAWNPRDALSSDYNRILKGQVTHEYCDVEVQYAVLTNVVVAVVEVVVVDANVTGEWVTTTSTSTAPSPREPQLLLASSCSTVCSTNGSACDKIRPYHCRESSSPHRCAQGLKFPPTSGTTTRPATRKSRIMSPWSSPNASPEPTHQRSPAPTATR